MQVLEIITVVEQVELVSIKDMTNDKILKLELIYSSTMFDNDEVCHCVVGNREVSYASSLLDMDNLDKTMSYVFKSDKIIITSMVKEQLTSILSYIQEVM